MNTAAIFSSKSSEWATPQDFFDKLNDEFNFNLDPCATKENAKCGKFFTEEQDGLKQNWGGTTYFAILHTDGKSKTGSERRIKKA